MATFQATPSAAPALPIRAVYAALAVTSLAVAGIHFAVMAEHFDEYFLFGLFFSVVAWLQALWALGIVASPGRPLLLAGLAGNALVVVVWLVSRTTGLPIGPEAGTPEPSAFLDVLSTVLEVGIVVVVATLLLRRRTSKEPRAGGPAALAVVGLALALIVLTTAAVASVGSEEEGGGHGGSGESEETAADPTLDRVDLGDGNFLQVLVQGSEGATQVHMTFFDAAGEGLAVDSLSMTGLSPSGAESGVPVERFDSAHYAATPDLVPGAWEFEAVGVTADGDDFAVTFGAEIP